VRRGRCKDSHATTGTSLIIVVRLHTFKTGDNDITSDEIMTLGSLAGSDRDQRHKSANNARLSEYVLWKNRYAQVSPCFQSRVHPEYIDKARDIEGLSTKEISDTVLTSTCNTSINDKLRYERKRQVSTPSRKKCGHLLRTSPEERKP
jgi:hypothetical protein